MKTIKLLLVTLVLSFANCADNTDVLPQNEMKTEQQVIKLAHRSTNEISAKNWLQTVPDNVYVSQLSIPGTHESSALYEGLSNTAKCQNLDIDKQLEIGVRYLDIRCRHFKNKFTIHHGPIYQHKNFSDVLSICKKFLQENPSEFIFMSIKDEHTAEENNRYFYQTFEEYVTNEANGLFFTEDRIPTLGEVRGKIILIRRFVVPDNVELGIQARQGFRDNRAFVIENSTNEFHVQDMYKVNENAEKWNLVTTMFNQCVNDKNPQHLYLNNTSGYKPGFFGIPVITAVSNQINNQLGIYLDDIEMSTNKNRKLGIIGIDFITATRAKQIYTIQDF